MQTFTGRCLCGRSHFTVDVEMLDVYACHCTLCQKWSGGIAMYLEACGQPQLAPPFPGTTTLFILFARRTLLLLRLRVSVVVSTYRYRSLFYSLDLTGTERR
ncbi:Glutathione-dependent formaldehyde-activating, GFA [Salmonella enterica subsp. arizonae]|uniref:Glutathione-dependent formaldehyde-activating, GFA n=1 Tax=Salmonella enterica subsp. arizonae TaxID=59203 RepID=A0A379SMC5_SALER|nr:Glutathione-dependent formaldehyde-activating, GFA [Salmonella enterica subsp. arizonae]